MRPVANSLFTAPWTAIVTTVGVGLAKATGEYEFIPRFERLWARGLAEAWGMRVSVVGGEDFDVDGPHIVVANHQSHVDIPILFMTLPVVPGFVAKKELARVPFLSMALRNGGHVLIDRSNRGSAMTAMRTAADDIRAQGKTIAVFPEGTRGDGRTLQSFKKGGFVLAKAAGVPLIPVGIRGSASILPRDGFLPRSGEVEVHIGAPISSEEVAASNVQQLSERARREIAALSGLVPE